MKIVAYIQDPKISLAGALIRFGGFITDKLYLKWLYRLKMGHKLNLNNPLTFTEKLQWLKLYDRNPEYTQLVDKAAVKHIVGEKIGFEHIIPTIGEWNSAEEIEWDKLPDQFVLKTTHGGGGGGVVICTNKNSFDIKQANEKLRNSLKSCIYRNMREWPYKNIPRKIIAEDYIKSDSISSDLKDYKIFCFNGDPKFLKVDFGRFTDHHANYYDLDWNLLNYGEQGLEPDLSHIEVMPKNFDLMLKMAKKLSQGFPFLRVDLYNIDGDIYFGELTLYPASGLLPWTDKTTDYKIGEMLKI